MKTMNLFRIGFLPLLALAFFACQKTDLAPSLTSNAGGKNTTQGGPVANWTVDITITKNECTEQVFTLVAKNQNGNPIGEGDGVISFSVDGGTPYEVTSGSTVTTHLSAGTHNLYASVSTGGNVRGESSSSIDVPTCSSCGLTADYETPTSLGNGMYEFTVTYTLDNCLSGNGKLQGGLVNDAVVASISGQGYEKESNGNGAPVIVWENVSSGSYSVTYRVARAAGESAITGNWSFKVSDTEYYEAAPLTFNFQ